MSKHDEEEYLQAFRDSVQRYTDLPPEQRPVVTYQGWDAKASRELAKYLSATLTKHRGSVIRTHLGYDPGTGEVSEWHAVYDKAGELLGVYNASHPCPPFCG